MLYEDQNKTGMNHQDRIAHESESHHNGIAHWKRNTTKQQSYDDQVMHAGVTPGVARDILKRNTTGSYSVVTTPSTGMGLEAENLLSFLTTGTHAVLQVPPQVEPTVENLIQEEETPIQSVQPALQLNEGFKVKRIRSLTFTNMLSRMTSAAS